MPFRTMTGRRRMRRWPLLAFAVVLASAACTSGSSNHSSKSKRPNIVVILSDDQRWDSMAQLPELNASRQWARFTNYFVEEPQCCPSRATLFTGRYSHHTGVDTLNNGKNLDDSRTIATMLHDAGYRTAQFGKYLNGYPFAPGHPTPPGWDDFVAYEGPVVYFNYRLNENGNLVSYRSKPEDYSTDVLTKLARQFIHGTAASDPVFVYLSLNAPHYTDVGLPIPAPRDRGSCKNEQFPNPPNFNAHDTVSEPDWMRGEKPAPPAEMAIARAATCETLRGVDHAVTSIIAELKQTGRLDNTYILFTSDNGYAFGEHRLQGKGDLYDEAIRVPMLVRGPDVKPKTLSRLTSNVDVTPTILDWASVKAPPGFLDGTSFAANLRGSSHPPDPQEILLRGCRTATGTSGVCGGYPTNMGFAWGLRTKQYKYVEYHDGYIQLFDLKTDPYELTNLAPDPGHASIVADLKARLVRLRKT
jgi:N-acetylglucosamine-6-sulfatase